MAAKTACPHLQPSGYLLHRDSVTAPVSLRPSLLGSSGATKGIRAQIKWPRGGREIKDSSLQSVSGLALSSNSIKVISDKFISLELSFPICAMVENSVA